MYILVSSQIRERDRVRPLAGDSAAAGRAARLRLHQRQLHGRLPEAECVHRDAGPPTGDVRRLLEDDLGAAHRHHRHDDEARGADAGACHVLGHVMGHATFEITPPR